MIMLTFYMCTATVAACCHLMYHYVCVYINIDVSNKDHNNSSDGCVIISGVAGGIILFLLMIIVVLCIVILCMRRSRRKKGSNVVDNTTKLNTNVTIDHNP